MKQYTIKDQQKVLKLIARMDFFSVFSPDEIKTLAKYNRHFAVYEKDDVIIKEGGSDTSFYILLMGDVSVTKGDPPRLIASLEPGDCFGEISFLTSTPRTANVVANTHTLTIKISREMLNELDIKIRERLKDNLIMKLVSRLDRMNNFAVKIKDQLPESIPFPNSPAYIP